MLAACGGLLLLRAPGSAGVDDGGRTLQRAWSVAAIPFPAWLILQTVPLPAGLVDLLSPARLAWARDAWPGPLTGCGGASLVAAAQPSFLSLSIEPHATREFLFRVVAAFVVFFAARALFAAHPRHRQYLLGGIAVVTALEAVYGLWQWVTKSPQVLWVAKTAYVDVATGTLINRNHYAALLYLGLGCTLALLMLRLDERPVMERMRCLLGNRIWTREHPSFEHRLSALPHAGRADRPGQAQSASQHPELSGAYPLAVPVPAQRAVHRDLACAFTAALPGRSGSFSCSTAE